MAICSDSLITGYIYIIFCSLAFGKGREGERKERQTNIFLCVFDSSKIYLTPSDNNKTAMTVSVAAPPLLPAFLCRRLGDEPATFQPDGNESPDVVASRIRQETAWRMDKWMKEGWEEGGCGLKEERSSQAFWKW